MKSIQQAQSPQNPPGSPLTEQLLQIQPEKKKHISKMLLLFFLFIVIALIVAGIMIFEAFTKKSAPSAITQTPTSSPLPTNTQKIVDTPSLTTYHNETTKFSFSYPSNLQKQEATYGLGVTSVEFKKTGQYPLYKMLVFPKALGKLINQDFDTFYKQADNTETIIKDPTSDKSKRFVKLQSRTVGSQRAFDFLTTASPPVADELPEVGVYIELDNNVLLISTSQDSKKSLDSILTTFQYPL